MNIWKKTMFAGVVAASLVGCGGKAHTGTTGTADSGMDNDGTVVDPCAGAPATLSITDNITTNTTWCTATTVTLTKRIYVEGDATLTIQAGVTVKGVNGSALVITRHGHLSAIGTAAAPIVMTSNLPAGSRDRANWGGLVLFGNAPVNNGDATGSVVFEGLTAEERNTYGGTDAAWDCAQLRYVRVEFGGQVFSPNKEFNGITFAGCGTATKASFVQAHMGADDGIEFFGGAPNVDHAVVTSNDDDGLDYDNGFHGHVQYYIVYHTEATHGDNAIEADNNATGVPSLPRSQPLIYNGTFISDGMKTRKITLRRATLGEVHNSIFQDFNGGLQIEPPRIDAGYEATYSTHWPLELLVQGSYFVGTTTVPATVYTNNTDLPTIPAGGSCVPVAPATTCPDISVRGMFDQLNLVSNAARSNTIGGAALITVGANTAPNFVPATGTASVSTTGVTAPTGWSDFDSAGLAFAGAVAPGATGAAIWYSGWTSFPAN